MENNKIVLKDGTVLIDTSTDTATVDDVANGKTFHSKSGEKLTGRNTKDSDTSDATASASTILSGDIAYSQGNRIVGEMPNNGGVNGTVPSKNGTYNVPQGYHDGSGKVGLPEADKAKLIPSNIRDGVTILGVQGEMSSTEGEISEANKDVTPSFVEQVVLPSEGFTCLKQVTVKPIKVEKTQNAAGGYTVTIG